MQAGSIIMCKMVFIVTFTFLIGEMDFYDRGILSILRDGKPRTFQQVLSEAEFSHNTLRQHIDELAFRRVIE